MRKKLIGAALALSIATPALAQQLNVYDGSGKLVGPLIGQDTVLVTLGGFQQYITLGKNGFAINADFYYADPTCGSVPLIAYDSWQELYPHAVYDGTTLYYLDPRQDAGYAVQSHLVNGKCVNLPDNQTMNSTSAHSVTPPWVPPFSVR